MEKTCFKCGETKMRSEFYAHPQMGDGLLGKCKRCTRKDAEDRRAIKLKDPEWIAKEQQRHRKKSKDRDCIFPEKRIAMNAARKIGKNKGEHLHHWSYKAEHRRDVIRLEAPHHRKAHRFLVYDQERMMYRRTDTMELLDTRERHEAYIRLMIETQED